MQTVDVHVIIEQAKIIYILVIKVNKRFSFLSQCFLKEIKTCSLCFYQVIETVLRELKKAVETLVCWLVFPQHFLFSQTSIHVSIT